MNHKLPAAAVATAALVLLLVSALLVSRKSRPMSASASSLHSPETWKLNPGLVADGNTVQYAKTSSQSSKYNAMFLGQGSHLVKSDFTVRIDSGSGVWIGWVRPSKFAQGWALRALMFGGNLSDGAGLLRSEFGPWPKQGDVVSTTARVGEDKVLSITFSVNGVALGKGFEIDHSDSVGELFPVVCFGDEDGQVSVLTGGVPSDVSAQQPPPPASGKAGKWESAGTTKPVGLNIEGDGTVLTLTFKVSNTIRTSIAQQADGKWKSNGRGMSTRMMPHGDYAALEQQVSALISSEWISIREVEGEPRFLEFTSSAGASFYFQPARPKPENPVTRTELERVLN